MKTEGSPEYANLVSRVLRALQDGGDTIVFETRGEYPITSDDVKKTAEILEGETNE